MLIAPNFSPSGNWSTVLIRSHYLTNLTLQMIMLASTGSMASIEIQVFLHQISSRNSRPSVLSSSNCDHILLLCERKNQGVYVKIIWTSSKHHAFRRLIDQLAIYAIFLRWYSTLHFQGQQTYCICNLIVQRSLQHLTVRTIGDFPSFLLTLESNNVFISKLLKMWSGGTPDVVFGTLKTYLLLFSLYRHILLLYSIFI